MYRRVLAAVALMALVAVGSAACARRTRPQANPTAVPSASASAAPTLTRSATADPTAPPSRTPTKSGVPATTPAPTSFPATLRGKDIEVIPTTRQTVALTFDAGSTDTGLRAVLDALSTSGVRATFFVTGRFADRYPASVRAIVAGGHRLGNHSYTHPYFTDTPDAQVRDELARAESAIRAAGGTSTRPLFRFPFGDRDSRTIATVNASGYACVRWTVDTLGWKGTVNGGITAQVVVDRILAGARPGAIMMMHVGANPDDGTTLDADALPAAITQLRARGYSFVTLDALLA
jgi:peptidoglycan/xylan/chitin deacetylase (PgdA/CDA1 family)